MEDLTKRPGPCYYPDSMKAFGYPAPQEDLLSLKNWAKNAASEFLRTDEFRKTKLALDILELSSQIELRLADLVGDARVYEPEYAPEGRDEEEEQGYPVFFVKGEFLVKQGRTRDKRDIYEQKLARVEFDRIVGALRQISQSKEEFDIRDVLSLISVPNYQIYLLLGVLQTLGLIQVPRRGMYSFIEAKRFPSESSSAWQRISANLLKGGEKRAESL